MYVREATDGSSDESASLAEVDAAPGFADHMDNNDATDTRRCCSKR